MVVGAVIDVLAAVRGEGGQHVHRVNARVGQYLKNGGIIRHGRIGGQLVCEHLRCHGNEDRVHGDALRRQLFLQLCERGCVGGELFFAVRRKLVHQVLVPADVNAAAFPFADGKLQIDLQRDPIVAQGDLIGEILLEFITELTGNEVDNGELRLLASACAFRTLNVITDKLRLNQILINIVGNAIKFTPVGGDIIIHLVERPCSTSGYAAYEFSIKDTGIGMSSDFLGHVFDTFAREQSATVSGIQGTGLGMAITKNIVEMMGGTVEVESEEGKSSKFTVTLTLRLADKPIRYEPIAELQGARKLVVDDDIETCRSVCKMLRSIDMQPDWTVTGKEAVLRAQNAAELKDEYKVYIVDYLMPDMNGIETIRRIRRVIHEDVPIIVLTAYDWADFEKEAREAGATAFVAKPIFMSELRSVLTKPVQMEEPKPEETEKTFDYSGKRVLLVEDNALNRELALAILGESGMQIDCAEDGIEAVNQINEAPEDRYDLVLMDIQMPRMDGYTATREIRTLPNNRKANVPIVAMTANAFEEDRKKAFECGMNGHIVKPIDRRSISKVLDQIFKEAK